MSLVNDGTLLHEWRNQTTKDVQSFADYHNYFDETPSSTVSKLDCFAKFVRRQALSKFISRAEIFKKIIPIHGSILDCGVNSGASLFTFAQLSAIFESVNYTRKIIGFDTFSGITGISDKDNSHSTSEHVREGGFSSENGMYENILKGAELFDENRNLGHIPKIELVNGDIRNTLPEYIKNNPHLVVSLLHLDMDIYEPTKLALELVLPRMPKGAVVIFDELNQPGYPGETLAVHDAVGISNLRIERLYYETGISFAVIE